MAVSIIVLTKNEDRVLRACLRTCTWADELVVVDSLSTDATTDVAREFTNKVVSLDWLGYGEQRNRAMEFASNEWVLFVDADERVSRPLREEIRELLDGNPLHAGYSIPRYNYCLGRRLRYGTFYPDAQLRLFRKSKARYRADQYVHEVPSIEGSVGHLKNPLLHLSHRSISTVLQDLDTYTTLRAKKHAMSRERPVKAGTLLKGLFVNVWRLFVCQQAWRDGMEGLIENLLVTFESFVTWAKIWELQSKDYDRMYIEIERKIEQSLESEDPLP